jgi:hypothetical protein
MKVVMGRKLKLSSEVRREIDCLVRGGFEKRNRIIEILCELFQPNALDEVEITVAVDAALAFLEKDKATWSTTTDCEKLDQVFAALNAHGIIALQNAGYTQSDGYEDIREINLRRSDRDKIVGYCFYHGQDLSRAVNGQGLPLAFGPMDSQLEQAKGPHVGAVIVEELERVGFSVQWNGTFAQRIYLPTFDWKRR